MNVPLFHVGNIRRNKAPDAYAERGATGRTIRLGVTGAALALCFVPTAGGGWPRGEGQFPRIPPEVIRSPDANQQNEINQQQSDKKNFDAINAERKKQIAEDSSLLLKLATDLKTEVDKTNKDTLSLNVIRKADAIEKLAHDVKEKMKLSIGSN